jgi:hypothetical protein
MEGSGGISRRVLCTCRRNQRERAGTSWVATWSSMLYGRWILGVLVAVTGPTIGLLLWKGWFWGSVIVDQEGWFDSGIVLGWRGMRSGGFFGWLWWWWRKSEIGSWRVIHRTWWLYNVIKWSLQACLPFVIITGLTVIIVIG